MSIDLLCLSHIRMQTERAREQEKEQREKKSEANQQQTAYTDKYTIGLVTFSHQKKYRQTICGASRARRLPVELAENNSWAILFFRFV